MLKEREPILEKLSVIFQVFLTLVCFLGAMHITHTYLKPVSWILHNTKYYYLSLFPYG